MPSHKNLHRPNYHTKLKEEIEYIFNKKMIPDEQKTIFPTTNIHKRKRSNESIYFYKKPKMKKNLN